MISAPGPLELLFLLGIALLVLGPTRLPEAARSAGKAVRELRDALSGKDDDEFDDQEELADAGPAGEAEYREKAAERELPRQPGTEAGDPAPPPIS